MVSSHEEFSIAEEQEPITEAAGAKQTLNAKNAEVSPSVSSTAVLKRRSRRRSLTDALRFRSNSFLVPPYISFLRIACLGLVVLLVREYAGRYVRCVNNLLAPTASGRPEALLVPKVNWIVSRRLAVSSRNVTAYANGERRHSEELCQRTLGETISTEMKPAQYEIFFVPESPSSGSRVEISLFYMRYLLFSLAISVAVGTVVCLAIEGAHKPCACSNSSVSSVPCNISVSHSSASGSLARHTEYDYTVKTGATSLALLTAGALLHLVLLCVQKTNKKAKEKPVDDGRQSSVVHRKSRDKLEDPGDERLLHQLEPNEQREFSSAYVYAVNVYDVDSKETDV